ncbi:MAG: hypothetical protein Q6363_010695 [Candidatus Njordarchaeota archaeon]
MSWFQWQLFFIIFFDSFFVGGFAALSRWYWRCGGRSIVVLLGVAVFVLFLFWRIFWWLYVAMCWPYYYPYLWFVGGVVCGFVLYYMLLRWILGSSCDSG